MDTKLKFNADYPVHVIKQIKKKQQRTGKPEQNAESLDLQKLKKKKPVKIHAFK